MKKLVLVTAMCLVLAGCGDDKDSGNPLENASRGNNPSGMPTGMPTGMPPMMPGGMPTGLPGPDMLKGSGTIKLTDEMMERYVKAVKALQGVDTPGEALLARYKFTSQEWMGISMIIGSSTARSMMSGAGARIDEQLAEVKAKRATATPQQKAMYDAQIKGLEAQKKAYADSGIGAANDVDKHNMAVLERWKDRLQAAGER